MIEFKGLGEVSVRVEGQPVALGGARQRRLLSMLLIHRNAVVSGDRLVDAVFGGSPTDGSATTLRSYVARVRRAIEGHDSRVRVVTQSPGYRLELPDELFDVAQFEIAVNEAGRSLSRGDPTAAVTAARVGIGRWTGTPYGEFDDEPWCQPEAQRLAELRLLASDLLFEAELACGRSRDLVPDIEQMVGAHPLRESFRAQLMLALYRSGRQPDALRAFQEYRSYLGAELGLEPSPSLLELENRIVAHDRSLAIAEGGRTLHGYRLGERLGSGTDGTLYAARLAGLEREFVLRSFRTEIADADHFVRRFESDAQRLAALRHPAIVTVHDYWRGPGEAYLVTARLRGGTLHDRLRSGPLDDRSWVVLVERIGGALVAATSNELVHGRIHASNIIYEDDLPYLTDFALGANHLPDDNDVAAFSTLLERSTGSPATLTHLRHETVRGSSTIAQLVSTLLARLQAEPVAVANPYKGLEAFDEADAVDFFGRGDLIDEILKRFADDGVRSRLVLVVGASGAGKSSAIRAGLLPRVRGGEGPDSARWLVTTLTPGANPYQRLADALTRLAVDRPVDRELLQRTGGLDAVVREIAGDTEVLLVVDQLEELFTITDVDVQQRFLGDLAGAVSCPNSRLRVVTTLRADFYDRPLASAAIAPFVNTATVAIPAMTAAGLEAAIVEPARRVGREVEGALVAELIGAVVHDASELPALQFTLLELAQRCDSVLTLAAYRELGGVSGAVAARAEQLYGDLSPDEQSMIRQLFERMVTIGDGESTRRRVPIADVEGGAHAAEIGPVIERWAAARLLTLDRDPHSHVPTVEIAHEALIRSWPRLGSWINEDRAAIATLTRLRDAAGAWSESGRDESLLHRGVALDADLALAEHRWVELSSLEREFVDASRLEADSESARHRQQLQRERRSNRRLRWQLAAVACLLVIALSVGWVAVDQRGSAEQARRSATARELASAAVANLDVDPERSMLLAMEAIDVTRSQGQGASAEAVSALHSGLVASRVVRRIDGVGGTVAWSPRGDYLVSEGPEESALVDLRRAADGSSVRRWGTDSIDINDVAFNSDGSMLATTGDDGALRLWDPDSGSLLASSQIPDGGGVWGPAFSADGTRAAAAWIDPELIRIIDTTSGELISEIEGYRAIAVSLSPDGTRIAFGSDGGPAYVVDVASGRTLIELDSASAGWSRIVRFSPDGRWIAGSGGDGITRVWDAATGERRTTLGETGSAHISLAWSADSRLLAVGSAEGSALVWDTTGADPRLLAQLTAQDTQSGVLGVAFSPDGSQLATGDLSVQSVIVWDISPLGGADWANARTAPFPPIPMTVSAGDEIVSVSTSGDLAAFSMDDGTERSIAGLPADSEMRIAADPTGAVTATAEVSENAPVKIWDTSTGELLASFVVPDFDEFVTGFSWSPDGEHLAISGGDGDSSSIAVVDRAGNVLASFAEEPEVYLRNSSFSPDGTTLVIPRRPLRQAVLQQQGVWIWNWQTSDDPRQIDTEAATASWDPAGTRIVLTSELRSTAEIWNVPESRLLTTIVGASVFNDARFSPDGAQVATAGDDGDVIVWDADEATAATHLRGHASRVVSVAYNADGTRLASFDVDGSLRIWALDVDDLIGIANERLTRPLTESECRQYLRRDTC